MCVISRQVTVNMTESVHVESSWWPCLEVVMSVENGSSLWSCLQAVRQFGKCCLTLNSP